MFKIKYKDLYLMSEDITDMPIPQKYYDENGNFQQRRFDVEYKVYRKRNKIFSVSFTDDINEASLYNNWDWNHVLKGIYIIGFRYNAKKIEIEGE